MVDIEPFYRWRDEFYTSEEDERSPFYGRTYNDMVAENTIYNYYIHPRWDYFDCETLYTKILSADYESGVAIMEFIGEWNDALHNDIMHLKRNVIEKMLDSGISKFILIMENVLNFHGDGDDYYAEWAEECQDSFNGGWIVFLNTFQHVEEEMHSTRIDDYAHFGMDFNEINWRMQNPQTLALLVERLMKSGTRRVN
jgi:hypothetical protein